LNFLGGQSKEKKRPKVNSLMYLSCNPGMVPSSGLPVRLVVPRDYNTKYWIGSK
jgi:hypothetical protein